MEGYWEKVMPAPGYIYPAVFPRGGLFVEPDVGAEESDFSIVAKNEVA